MIRRLSILPFLPTSTRSSSWKYVPSSRPLSPSNTLMLSSLLPSTIVLIPWSFKEWTPVRWNCFVDTWVCCYVVNETNSWMKTALILTSIEMSSPIIMFPFFQKGVDLEFMTSRESSIRGLFLAVECWFLVSLSSDRDPSFHKEHHIRKITGRSARYRWDAHTLRQGRWYWTTGHGNTRNLWEWSDECLFWSCRWPCGRRPATLHPPKDWKRGRGVNTSWSSFLKYNGASCSTSFGTGIQSITQWRRPGVPRTSSIKRIPIC